MIAEFKPYASFKDTGVPWLEEVPAHWQVRRLKTLCTRSALYGANVTATSYTTVGVRFLRTTDINDDGQLSSEGVFVPEELVQDYLLADDDILISRSGTIGRSFLYSRRVHGHCAYAGYLVRFVPATVVLPKYLFLFTKTRAFAGFLRVMAISSTIENLNGEKYANAPLPLPPPSEQAAIVRFLDHADRRIRRYIRAKQKLIALLEEQKQAIIHQAVTGQIDVRSGQPYPSYKPSGVEWLGDVPRHWKVVRLKFVAEKIVDCLHETPKYSETGQFPAIRTADISPGFVHFSSARRIEEAEYVRWIERLEPMPGDILYSREGERFGIAACVPDGVKLCISQRMMVFRIRANHNPDFVMWALNSRPVLAQARQDIMGATAPHVNVSTIRNYFLALPSRDEQDALVHRIESETNGFSRAIAGAERGIAYLREYRTRLIADVVTGKLDVREAAAALPDVDPWPRIAWRKATRRQTTPGIPREE